MDEQSVELVLTGRFQYQSCSPAITSVSFRLSGNGSRNMAWSWARKFSQIRKNSDLPVARRI